MSAAGSPARLDGLDDAEGLPRGELGPDLWELDVHDIPELGLGGKRGGGEGDRCVRLCGLGGLAERRPRVTRQQAQTEVGAR